MGSNSRTYVILGGAGYVGIFLVNSIINKFPDSRVIIVTNNLTKAVFFRSDNVELTNNVESISGQNIQLINLAYSLGEQFSDTKYLNKRILRDIRKLIENNIVKSFVHVSSVVLSQYKKKWNSVSVTTDNIYYYAKSFVEVELLSLSKEKNVPVAILRSGNIMGPGSPWVLQIIKRLNERKPISGKGESYPSNTTFVGNLCEAIITLAESIFNDSVVMNCCEFGNVSWNEWTKVINRKLNQQVCTWEIDSVNDLKPSLRKDLSFIIGKVMNTAIPLFYKGRSTNRKIIKLMDILGIRGLKNKMKLKVGNSTTKSSQYIDLTEYEMVRVFMNEEKFQLEGMPDNIKSSLVYSYESTIDAIYLWMNLNGID